MRFRFARACFPAAEFLIAASFFCSLILIAQSHAQEGPPPASLLPLTFSYSPVMPSSNIIIASRGGFFKTAGLDVQHKLLGSSDLIRSGLISGDIEIATMSTDTLARAHAAGFDWKLLYPADIYDSRFADAALVVRADSPIASAKDLEGKTVAVATGSVSEAAFRAYLRANGADVSRVKIVEYPFAQIVGALQSKQIDAAHLIEPSLSTAVNKGIAKVLYNHLDMVRPRYLVSSVVAKGSWIDANPEKAKRFVEAMTASTKFVLEHPADALPLLSAETKIDPAVLSTIFPKHYVIATAIQPEEIQAVVDFLVNQKMIDKTFSYKDIISPYMPISND
jgi:NitT/TauT family transport system substrate-binding protein